MDDLTKPVIKFFANHLDSSNKTRNTHLATGFAIGICTTFMLTLLLRTPHKQAENHRPITSDAWQLTVTLRFKTLADKDAFLPIFEPLAKYVEENEFSTLSYIISESDKDPKQLFILERYTSKKNYLDVHKKSKEFINFREKLLGMQTKGRVAIDGQSYQETNIGYIN